MEKYTNSWIEGVIDENVHSKRNREILKLTYIDGVRQETIAEQYELSVRQIQNIVRHFRTHVLAKIKTS